MTDRTLTAEEREFENARATYLPVAMDQVEIKTYGELQIIDLPEAEEQPEQTTIADGQVLGIIGHHFGGGVYIKEMKLKDGAQVKQHKHEFDHLSYLVSGCVIVEVDGEMNTYYAPRSLPIPAHKQHTVTPVNGDAVWLCIWKTDCEDIDSVDEVLIEKQA